jgi:hypothetical protein
MQIRLGDPAHGFAFNVENLCPEAELRRRNLGMPVAVQRFMRQRYERDFEARRNPELGKRDDCIARSKMTQGIAGSRANDQNASELVFNRENGERLVTLEDLIVSSTADIGADEALFVDDRAV